MTTKKYSISDIANFLSQPSKFATLAVGFEGEPLQLDDYQADILDSRYKYEIWAKSRRVGWSFSAALKAFLRAMFAVKPYRACIISKDQAEANDKISFVKDFWNSISEDWKNAIGKKLVINNKSSIGWESSNGFTYEIRSYPARPVRGLASDVFFDEMAHCRYSREIFLSALPIVARGNWIFNIGSTPNGEGDTFWNTFFNSNVFGKRMIYWWDCGALCSNVGEARSVARMLPIEERIRRFATDNIKEQFEQLPVDVFRQEFEIDFLALGDAFLSRELIDNCKFAPYPINLDDYEDERDKEYFDKGKKLPMEERYPQINFRIYKADDPYDTVRLLAKACSKNEILNHLQIGMDLGQDGTITSITFLENLPDFELEIVRSFVHLYKWKKSQIIDFVDYIMNELPIASFYFDSTGAGYHYSEEFSTKKYKYKVKGINFSSRYKKNCPIKEAMASNLKVKMEEMKLAIPDDPEYIRQLRSVKIERTGAGNIVYKAEKRGITHADDFWSLAMASFASNYHRRTDRASIKVGENTNRLFATDTRRKFIATNSPRVSVKSTSRIIKPQNI